MNCPKCGSDRVHSIGEDHVCLACESRILSPIPDDPRVLRAKMDALNLRVKVLEKALAERRSVSLAEWLRAMRATGFPLADASPEGSLIVLEALNSAIAESWRD